MRALITGASPGIGGVACLTLAKAALARGQKPMIAACEVRETDGALALVQELRGMGAEARLLTGDLADPAVPARLVSEAVAAFGGLDAVVSNAGITSPAPLAELELEAWDKVMNINLRGAWLLAKAAYPHLKESRGGMVLIASMSGMNPHRGMGSYSASKAGTIILGQQLAQEWAVDGIRGERRFPRHDPYAVNGEHLPRQHHCRRSHLTGAYRSDWIAGGYCERDRLFPVT